MIQRSVFSFVFLLGWVVTSVASAYIPPSEFIVDQLVKKRAALRSARLKSIVTLYESERLGTTHFRVVTFYSHEQNLLRTWITDDQDRRLYTLDRPLKRMSPVMSLLLDNQTSNVVQALKARKIPIQPAEELLKLRDEELRREAELTYLSRFQGQVGWVIARSIKSGPQLWVDKDTFFPIRLVFDREVDSDTMDVRFEPFRVGKDLSLPRAIVVAQGSEKLFFREEFTEVVPNAGPIAGVAPGATHATQVSAGLAGFSELGNSVPSELRNLILQYLETLR